MEHASSARARSSPTRETRHRRELVSADLVLIAAAIGIGIAAQWGVSAQLMADAPRLFVIGALAVLWPVLLWDQQTRAGTILGSGPEEYRRVLMASMWTLCFAAAAAYATGTTRAREFLLGVTITGLALLFIGRNVMRIRLHRSLRNGPALYRVFVVAPNSQQGLISEQIEAANGVFERVGLWDLGEGVDPDPAVVVKAASDAGADTLVYSPSSHADPTWPRRLGWAMEDSDLSLLVSPALTEIAGPRLSIEPVQSLAMVRVRMPRFSGPARVVKRTLDIVGSVVGLILMAIPMLLIALIIKRGSPGPVFFSQERAGAAGTTFRCWKFRTMIADADRQRARLRAAHGNGAEAATFKMVADPRITRVGQFLRRYSLDELPQLFNVLAGQMSLVGPRPHPLDDVERYDDVATRRLLAKPGMTGLWQVSGRSDLEWQDAVMLDLYYVENWSISMDTVILLRTVKAVLAGGGAY